jgi:hypothetical protein
LSSEISRMSADRSQSFVFWNITHECWSLPVLCLLKCHAPSVISQ